MKFLRIEIENWGPIKEIKADIDPNARIILLNGTNGAGKSCLIDALGNLLCYHRAGNTWGGNEMITTGAERARICATIANDQGQTITLQKIYQRNGRTLISAQRPNQETIKHSDAIRQELIKLFGSDPQEALSVLIAKQTQIADLLHGEPSVREREFLNQINLKHVVDAEARLLESARSLVIDEATGAILEEKQRDLANRIETRTLTETQAQQSNQELKALESNHTLYLQWQKVQQEQVERTHLETQMNYLCNQVNDLDGTINQLLGDIPRDSIAAEIARCQTIEVECTTGQQLETQWNQLQSVRNQFDSATERRKENLRLAALFTPEQAAQLQAAQQQIEQTRKTISQDEARARQLQHTAQELEKATLGRQPEPPAAAKQKLLQTKETAQKLSAELQAIQPQLQTTTQRKNAAEQALRQAQQQLANPKISGAPAASETFHRNATNRALVALIQQTLDQWGTTNTDGQLARCPVSHLELDPSKTEAKGMAAQKLAQLQTMKFDVSENPEPFVVQYTQAKTAEAAAQQQIQTATTELSVLQTTAQAIATQLRQLNLPDIDRQLQQWETLWQAWQRSQSRVDQAQQAWKTIEAVPKADLPQLNQILQNLTTQAQTLIDARSTATANQTQAQRELANLQKLEPLLAAAQTAQTNWEAWRNQHPTWITQGIQTIANQTRELRYLRLEPAQSHIKTQKEKREQITHLISQTTQRQWAPKPTIPLEQAQLAEQQYQTTITITETVKASFAKAQAEEQRARQELEVAKAKHEKTQKQKRVRDALNVAAQMLNYERIPREIANTEFSKVLAMTNGLLREVGIEITLSHTNFEVFAGQQKKDIGWVYNTVRLLSGGEKTITGQAMRLAAKKRLAPNFNFMVLDEPSTSVAEENIEKLTVFFDALRNGLEGLGIRQLILAEHHAKLRNIADQVISW